MAPKRRSRSANTKSKNTSRTVSVSPVAEQLEDFEILEATQNEINNNNNNSGTTTNNNNNVTNNSSTFSTMNSSVTTNSSSSQQQQQQPASSSWSTNTNFGSVWGNSANNTFSPQSSSSNASGFGGWNNNNNNTNNSNNNNTFTHRPTFIGEEFDDFQENEVQASAAAAAALSSSQQQQLQSSTSAAPSFVAANTTTTSSTTTTSTTDAGPSGDSDVLLLVQAANSAAKVFDSSFNRAVGKLAQSAETVHAVSESACASIDHRTNLLTLCAQFAGENKILRAKNGVLSQTVQEQFASSSETFRNEDGAEEEQRGGDEASFSRRDQFATSLIATKAQNCINKTFDSIRSVSEHAIQATVAAHSAALSSKNEAVQAKIERSYLADRIKTLEHEIDEKNQRLTEMQTVLRVSIHEEEQENNNNNNQDVAAGSASPKSFTSKKQQIEFLRQSLRNLESKVITQQYQNKNNCNDNVNHQGEDSSSPASLLLVDALHFLDSKRWTVSELVLHYNHARSEEERLRLQVREQAVDISHSQIKSTELESKLAQSQWKVSHLERLLQKTASTLNRTFEADVLAELNAALNSKAAITVMLEDTKRRLSSISAQMSELEVKYESATDQLNRDKMMQQFELVNGRRDAKLAESGKKLSETKKKLHQTLEANIQHQSQYESLKGMVFAMQNSSSTMTNKLKANEQLLRDRSDEIQRLKNEISQTKNEKLEVERRLASSKANNSSSNSNQSQNSFNNNNNNNNSVVAINQTFIAALARLEKTAMNLVSATLKSSTSNNNNNNFANEDAAAFSSSPNSFSNINVPDADSSSSSQLPIVNHILKNFQEALQAAEKVRVGLLQQITSLSLEVDRLDESHQQTSDELLKTQQRLQHAEVALERSSSAFTSAVLGRQTDNDDSELRIAALQRSVSRLQETEQKSRLQHDQIALVSQSCGQYRERIGEILAALATAEGRMMASLFREEEARRTTLSTSAFGQLQNLYLLSSLSRATVLSSTSACDNSEFASETTVAGEDSDGNQQQQQQNHQQECLAAIAQQIKEAITPVQAVHESLLAAVDSAVQAEEEGLNSPTHSIAKLCSVLDSVLGYWRGAALRDHQGIIVGSGNNNNNKFAASNNNDNTSNQDAAQEQKGQVNLAEMELQEQKLSSIENELAESRQELESSKEKNQKMVKEIEDLKKTQDGLQKLLELYTPK